MPTQEELADRKAQGFDPALSQVMAKRVVYNHQITDPMRYRPIMALLGPLIAQAVNPPIIRYIAGRSPGLPLASLEGQCNYKLEDEVQREVRKLVEFYHGSEDRRLCRNLVDGCMSIIGRVVNSEEFTIQMYDTIDLRRPPRKGRKRRRSR